ncbi:Scr1 family TA system antitoxin-like transcriptional regulator [Saccharopolyspora shandongensis]|uniref:Scr1 family TA system antitoxin-like transcriptional regulator n=1 Tax=Saccharopolyspora shandongensis TaxID=418495 RepID=UPI0033C5FBCF
MPRSPGGSPKARNLGAELRKARESAGVTAVDLARKLDVSRPKIQRWEIGTTVPTPAEVAGYLAVLGVNGAERDRVVALAEDVDAGNWITSDVAGASPELTTFIECERTCTSITDVSPLVVPGLLQTARYMRAVMTGLSVSATRQ